MPLANREKAQDNNMSAAASAEKAPKRNPPVRRNPERRRQQNIEAQRRYREKLRQRLGNLEAIAASVSHGVSAALEASANKVAVTTPASSGGASSHATPGSLLVLDELEDVSAPVSPSTPAYPQVVPDENQWAMVAQPDDETPPSASSWDSIVHLDPSILVGRRGDKETGLTLMVRNGCGCSSTREGLQRIVRHRGGAQSLFGAPTTGDPYYSFNHLRLETVCTLDAMFSLGTLLGIPSERMCPRETPSPFFRPGIASADAISTVQKIFQTLKPDLRPSCEQVTVAHHPFIDCLPFPTLRRNLLIHQAHIDAHQLQLDVIEGLVCWGGAGISKRDHKDFTGCASTGTPWDVRSWEAKECFLQKYWTLLGGEEGELVRQSEWWRSIRGDEPLDLCALSQ